MNLWMLYALLSVFCAVAFDKYIGVAISQGSLTIASASVFGFTISVLLTYMFAALAVVEWSEKQGCW